MKKKVSKVIALLSASVLTIGMLGGCVNKVNRQPVNSETPDISTLPGQGSEVVIPDVTEKVTEEDLLVFVDEGASAKVYKNTFYGLQNGKSYTLEEMKAAIEETYLDTYGDFNPKQVVEINYAIIDCGNDGIPELAIRVVGDNSERMDEVDNYYIIKRVDGELRVVDAYEAYYRSWGELNKYGVYHSSGSGGASLMAESYVRVNAQGEHEFIYSAEYELAMGEPMIFGYEIPSDVELPDDYPAFAESYGNNERGKYSFVEDNLIFVDGSKEYDDYLRQLVYVFHDPDGKQIMPSEENMKLYTQAGLTVTDDNDLDSRIASRLSELGISDEEMKNPSEENGVEPQWKVAWDGLEPQP